jgi:hypothetical protein
VSGVCVTNNNGFWIWWFDLLNTSSQLQSIIALSLIYLLHKSLAHASFLSLYSQLLREVRSSRVTLRLAVYRQSVCLGDKPLETHDQHFFQLNTCFHNPYVTSSLTRGWVCSLQFLLALASAFSGRSPVLLVIIFYCLKFDTPSTCRGRSQYLYLTGKAWPSYTPRHWIRFSSPSTTRRATVNIFDPASTRTT